MTGHPDHSQREVIDAPIDVRLVVAAPPGSGKTWTAAERLCHLAGQGSDEDGGLLALSFSRAASFALSAQLHRAGVGAKVEVRTIDSWAARFADQRSRFETERHGYDDSIARAVELLSNSPDAIEYRHIVVDEAQDVHGTRATLVEALLCGIEDRGWTILGDGAQAIFEFGADHTAHLMRRMEGLTGVRRMALTECHRAQTDRIDRIVRLGEHLRADVVEATDRRAVWDAYHQLKSLDLPGLLLATHNYARGDTRTAVLLRDNRRVLEISGHLANRGVQHDVTSARAEGSVPAWVARLCLHESTVLDNDDIEQRVPEGIDPVPVLRAVRSVCRTVANRVLTEGLADRILSRRVPEALLQGAEGGLTVSTIHRAKGLEYDKVFVSMRGATGKQADDESDDDATRVLYVAMTRARSDLHRLQQDSALDSCRDRRSGRWTDIQFVGKRRPTVAFEVGPTDINFFAPWHGLAERLVLIEEVMIGAPVRFDPGELGPTGLPTFVVVAGDADAVLGTTTPALGEMVERLGWPSTTLVGARVVGRSTTALPRGADAGNRRLIVAPIIRGMVSEPKGSTPHG